MSLASFQRRLSATVLLAGLCTAAACTSVSVSTEVSPLADFARRKTYSWMPNPQLGGQMDESIAGQQVRADVDRALQAHGFRPVPGFTGDMAVDYRVTLRRELNIEGGPEWGPGWGPAWDLQPMDYIEGTLVLMLVDPVTQDFLWRGVGQGIVDPTGSGSSQAADIEIAVQKMFASFPN